MPLNFHLQVSKSSVPDTSPSQVRKKYFGGKELGKKNPSRFFFTDKKHITRNCGWHRREEAFLLGLDKGASLWALRPKQVRNNLRSMN